MSKNIFKTTSTDTTLSYEPVEPVYYTENVVYACPANYFDGMTGGNISPSINASSKKLAKAMQDMNITFSKYPNDKLVPYLKKVFTKTSLSRFTLKMYNDTSWEIVQLCDHGKNRFEKVIKEGRYPQQLLDYLQEYGDVPELFENLEEKLNG